MKSMKKAVRILTHLTIILALCFLVLSVLDWFNPQMAFRTNPMSSLLLVVFCLAALLSSAGNILLASCV